MRASFRPLLVVRLVVGSISRKEQPITLANDALTFLRWFSFSTLRADGTTKRFFWSYGGGMPSNTRSLPSDSSPLGVLCGSMPRTVLQKILLGARKWCGPWFGLTLHRLRKKSRYFTVGAEERRVRKEALRRSVEFREGGS